MTTPSTRRKARDIVLNLMADVNDRQNHRFFRVCLNLEDEVDMQIANDLTDAFHDHGAPIVSHAVRSFLTENDGRQKVMTELTFVCRILHGGKFENKTG